MKKMLLAAAAGTMLLQTTALAAPAGSSDINPPPQPIPSLDAGTQMNTFQGYIERERAEQEVFKQREGSKAQVEDEHKKDAQDSESQLTFQLNKIQVDESQVLTPEDISKVTAKYEGQSVSINQLYDIVEDINKLYEDKGYITCRAYLKPQKIENGVVAISLLESSVGQAVITGNAHTNSEYILERVPLKEGEINSIQKLNKDILHFNGTNDAQLRIVLKAGEKEGTTDYYIQVKEPKNNVWTVFADNMGSENSGEYRLGVFYNDRSLSGRRDSLTLGTVFSQGTRAFSAMYSYPLGHSGTKLNLSYSTNRVKQIKNDDITRITGRAQSYTIGITQPWIVTDRYRSEFTLDYTHQTSKSDYELVGRDTKFTLIDDTINNWTLGLAMTNYGSDSIFYQKHSITRGQSNRVPWFCDNRPQDFTFYKLSALYQKLYKSGNQLSLRLDGQYSFKDNLISSRQYYIGGMYSVRGYAESFMGGDGGLTFSAEYTVPLRKDRKLQGFWFFDYGRIIGETAESNNEDNQIYSTGLGLKAALGKNINGVLTLGVPLKKSFNSKIDDVDSVRVNFMISGQF